MSYILDALKRADAERERGAVPGLHARPIKTPAAPTAYSAQRRVWLAVGTTLTLGGIAAGLWVWQTPGGDTRLAAPLAQTVPTPTPTPIPAPAPAPVPVPVPAVQPAVPARPAVAPLTPTVPPTAPATPKAKPLPLPLPVAKASAPQAAAAAVPLLSELSEDIRREIPPLTITGTVYSANPGQRLLLVNGLVLTQGSRVAPDLNLEEIRARNSVFNFRGTRFRVAQ